MITLNILKGAVAPPRPFNLRPIGIIIIIVNITFIEVSFLL